jgi:hypothetical protein
MDEIEELFGTEGGQPQPRRGLVLGLLSTGLVLAILGMGCSAAPGGALVLAAWVVAEKEVDRVESGYLPWDLRAEVRRLYQLTLSGVVAVLLLFVVQGWLLYIGFYDTLWGELVAAVLAPGPV